MKRIREIFDKIRNIIIPIALIILGVQFMQDSLGLIGNDRISDLEQLIESGVKVDATLKKEYEERTIKIARIPIKTYEFGYTFNVKGKVYEGNKVFNKLPDNPIVSVSYLPEDPNINSLEAKEELKNLQERQGSISAFLFGLVMMIIGIFWGYNGVKKLRNKAITQAQPARSKRVGPIAAQREQAKIEKFSNSKAPTAVLKTKDENLTSSPSIDKNLNKSKFINRNSEKSPSSKGLEKPKSKWEELKNKEYKEFEPSDHSKYLPK